MTVYSIIPATYEHGVELADNMRQADIDEIWASVHMTPREALDYSLRISTEAYTGLADDKVVGIFGVVQSNLFNDNVIIWFLSSKELPKHRRKFLLLSKQTIDNWRSRFKTMTCYVDKRYEAAIKWVNWLGFKALPPIQHGPDNRLFYPFELRT